jgi:hypothetical protein
MILVRFCFPSINIFPGRIQEGAEPKHKRKEDREGPVAMDDVGTSLVGFMTTLH